MWIFECSVFETGFTVWNGTLFNCPSSNNKIILFHNQYTSSGGIVRSCNNEDVTIVGESIGVDGNNYTSRITVTGSSDLTGAIIECRYDNGAANILIMRYMIGNEVRMIMCS